MKIIEKVLNQEELIIKPPVLLDIGAAGKLDSKWKLIAKYSICIAFDADQREMGYIVKESSYFKKLYIYNCIVTSKPQSELDFYLTKSPQCSSSLKPDLESLKNFAFADLFQVEKEVKLPAKELFDILKELNIDYIDWFKTDSQGTDLRLFMNLGEDIIKRVLVAEFEAGIMDAYQGEDKFHQVMSALEKNFWMSDIIIKGSQRINQKILNNSLSFLEKKYINEFLKTSPGWAEVTYFNKCQENLSKREILLAWIFAIIEKQYGFALELAYQGQEKFSDPLFQDLIDQSLRNFKQSYLMKIPYVIVKRGMLKLLSIIHN